MGDTLRTEPAYPLSRTAKEKRPWWAVALISGLGAGVTIAGALGFSGGMQARGTESPQPSTASIATAKSDNDRLNRIEGKLDEALQRISHIEGRLDRGK